MVKDEKKESNDNSKAKCTIRKKRYKYTKRKDEKGETRNVVTKVFKKNETNKKILYNDGK